jgi:hypothetical protein
MASLLSDPEKVRELLDKEHELNAMVIEWVFDDDPVVRTYVDNEEKSRSAIS